MFKLLRDLFSDKADKVQHGASLLSGTQTPPEAIVIDGAPSLYVKQYISRHEGYPIMDWDGLISWVDELGQPKLQAQVWAEVERAWLLYFRDVLGAEFRLAESSNALLLSSLEDNVTRATLDYMERTLKRVIKTLDGIAQLPPWGKDILIVFGDDESYYRYVSYYYPDAGEFAFSGGMHINAGCSHYVTVKGDLRSIEPIIAHEMTHGCLSHFPLPAWLNEGIAVNTEQRLTGVKVADYTLQQLRQKHLEFWREGELQEFWSGKSFLRTDDGNLLSYDLARIIVEHMAKDWESFKRFVLAAGAADAGATAAHDHLGIDLGELVCALLERVPSNAWAPDPEAWMDEPERGGFAPPVRQQA